MTDYYKKYLKYKKKYLDLKGGVIDDVPMNIENNDVVNMNQIIQQVLNMNEQQLINKRNILRNQYFVADVDPLNRRDRPINFIPPDPEAGRLLRRQWASINPEEEENADNERKRYLLDHHFKVNWTGIPPSWWPFNS